MDKSIDVLLYVDRLDGYRFDSLDRQLVKAITRTFGKQVDLCGTGIRILLDALWMCVL